MIGLIAIGCSNQPGDGLPTASTTLLAQDVTEVVVEIPTAEPVTLEAMPVEPTATPLDVTASIPATPQVLESGDPVPADILAAAEAAWGPGGVYVASLPRPNDVPAGWLLGRQPQFQARSPEPGETYSFACQDLPARSTGVASVGYLSLEGLPSLSIEYVLYPTPEDALDAFGDMQRAAELCGSFTVESDGTNEAVAANIAPLPISELGDMSFGFSLETSSETAGELTTHVIKILRDDVIIGLNHAVLTGDPLPDTALSEAVARLSLGYLSQIE